MRGVRLEPGQHEIVWRFQPPNNGLAVSIMAIIAGLGMCGYLAVSSRGKQEVSDPSSSEKPAK
jgi:hypothetical protein